MFEYAVIFLLVALITGTLGLTNVSDIAKKVSLVLFAVFFLMFLARRLCLPGAGRNRVTGA